MTAPTQDDGPEVAAEISAMTSAWNKRLLMACLTLSTILAFFALEMRARPDFAEQLLKIAPWFLGLIVAFTLAVRWAVSRESRRIRGDAQRPPRG